MLITISSHKTKSWIKFKESVNLVKTIVKVVYMNGRIFLP
ncbi:hypothetical protein CU002_2558 [Enterococcus faecium]|nr:hypothetical protein [Enterococcus faecium]